MSRPCCVRCGVPIGDGALLFGPGDQCERCVRISRAPREPYPQLPDTALDAVIEAWTAPAPEEPAAPTSATPDERESEAYERWCQERERKESAA